MNQDKQLLGFVAIAIAAVFVIYLTSMPKRTPSDASSVANIAPAAGDVVPGGVGTPQDADKAEDAEDNDAHQAVPDTGTDTESSLEKNEAYSVEQIFATEEECTQSTNKACHFVKCEDAPAVGTEEEERAIENACQENEKSGWRPVVPAPDKTAIPEEVAPPLKINHEAPASP